MDWVLSLGNANRITQTDRDMPGRTIYSIANYVDGSVSETEPSDTEQTTQYLYDDHGRLSHQIALNPLGAGNGVQEQDPLYLYEDPVNGGLRTNGR